MKKNLILAAVAVFVFTMAASAQDASFAGTWNLDVAKSKIAGPPIESQTLVISQTATEIKVEQTTKRGAPPADAPQGGRPGGGPGGRGGMMGGGDGTTTFNLDGKGVKSEMQGGMGSMTITTTSKIEGSTLNVTRSIETPMGARESSEKWTIGADGTLTIESQRPNREGGMDTTTRVFIKK